mmetsp:Transcript_8576/g.20451  ORF Transcript_8576/g.20451 Transcript_8576/m.20451 type:complete len:209 (-) Transcript_8576:1726-2352(-)
MTMSAAIFAALPLMSVPDDAAVATVFAHLSVAVSAMYTADKGISKQVATTWATFVCRPCPISMPPCDTRHVPSLYTCTSAQPWFSWVAVKEIPNMVGMAAIPLFLYRFRSLNTATAACLDLKSDFPMRSDHSSVSGHGPTSWPKKVFWSDWYRFAEISSSRVTPSSVAACSYMTSPTNIPCGPPNPRKAVFDGVLVLAICPRTRTLGT